MIHFVAEFLSSLLSNQPLKNRHLFPSTTTFSLISIPQLLTLHFSSFFIKKNITSVKIRPSFDEGTLQLGRILVVFLVPFLVLL